MQKTHICQRGADVGRLSTFNYLGQSQPKVPPVSIP